MYYAGGSGPTSHRFQVVTMTSATIPTAVAQKNTPAAVSDQASQPPRPTMTLATITTAIKNHQHAPHRRRQNTTPAAAQTSTSQRLGGGSLLETLPTLF